MSQKFERRIVLTCWTAGHRVDSSTGLPIDPPREIELAGKTLAFPAFDVVVSDEDGREIIRCGPSHEFANWMIEGGFVKTGCG